MLFDEQSTGTNCPRRCPSRAESFQYSQCAMVFSRRRDHSSCKGWCLFSVHISVNQLCSPARKRETGTFVPARNKQIARARNRSHDRSRPRKWPQTGPARNFPGLKACLLVRHDLCLPSHWRGVATKMESYSAKQTHLSSIEVVIPQNRTSSSSH